MPDITHKYKNGDIDTMILQISAINNFAELLDNNYDKAENGSMLASIALIIKTLVQPLEAFLERAVTYAELPSDTEEPR